MYLSSISINGFRSILNLDVKFNKDINVIIGENASGKSALIDAIRLIYNLGNQQRDLFITKEDFYYNPSTSTHLNKIEIKYVFKRLSEEQKGAFYEYLVIGEDPSQDYAQIVLRYELVNDRIQFYFYSGEVEGQKPSTQTFSLFQHYYLGALRDSTRDLLSSKDNILANLLNKVIRRQKKETDYENLMKDVNKELIAKKEITEARDGINTNLGNIFKNLKGNKIGLNIQSPKLDYIVKAIRPFLPHDISSLDGEGFNLWCNSLGFNNLIYISTILGDIEESIENESLTQFALLIEEPEAHLHPQLQLSLFRFLCDNSSAENSQLIITSHSPTVTSKAPFQHLILLKDRAYKLDLVFRNREEDNLIKDGKPLLDNDYEIARQQLQRYLDVTRSQMLFAKGILFVEGISEEILIPTFCRIQDFNLEDYGLELVNVEGTSFYPFIHLFNSTAIEKRLPLPITILTDDDRYTQSKKSDYSFKNLITHPHRIKELQENINKGSYSKRIDNLKSLSIENPNGINIQSSFKTFEYDIAYANISNKISQFAENSLIRFIRINYPKKLSLVETYLKSLANSDDLSDDHKQKIALLIWKVICKKVEFAQKFALFLEDEKKQKTLIFKIPDYILTGLNFLKNPPEL